MASEPKKSPEWMGRPIAKDSDVHELEQASATHEFGSKLPRAEAEQKAYDGYKRVQHAKAAAHHLAGIKGAHAAGDSTEARKHSVLYQLHLQALGHSPSDPVPDEVKAHLEGGKEPKVFRFKPHPADLIALQQETSELGKS